MGQSKRCRRSSASHIAANGFTPNLSLPHSISARSTPRRPMTFAVGPSIVAAGPLLSYTPTSETSGTIAGRTLQGVAYTENEPAL